MRDYRVHLDKYFDDSFFHDLDFFYYVLTRDHKFASFFIILLKFAKDVKIRKQYAEMEYYFDRRRS